LLLALVAAAFLLWVPLTSKESTEVRVDPVTGEQREVHNRGSETLLDSEGASVIPLLAVPVLLAGLGVAVARPSSGRRFTLLVVVYGIGVLLAMASIGIFFIPSLLALVLARWRSGADAAVRASADVRPLLP